MATHGSAASPPGPSPSGWTRTVLAIVLGAILAVSACGTDGSSVASGAATDTTPRRTDRTAAVLAAPPDPAPGSVPLDDVPREAPVEPPVPAAPVPAPLAFGIVELDLVDSSRPTVTRGTTIAGSRSLPTVVTFPTGPGGPWPLVVFAHGFRLGPPGYTRLIETLTSAGYVVAAPSFPLADEEVAGAQVDRGDIPNQSRDVSFVIDGVIASATDPGSPLAGRVDGSRVGAVGHSDGADTVLDVGYVAGRADGRVRAIVALSPDAVVPAGTPVGGATPLLVQHGDADTVVPYSESVAVFGAVSARRYLLTLIGAGHSEPVTDATAWTPVLDATVVAFLDHHVAGSGPGEATITDPASASAITRIETAG